MLDIAILANSVQHDGSGLRSLKAFEVCWFEALLFATCSAARHTSNICALTLDLSDVLEVAQESYRTSAIAYLTLNIQGIMISGSLAWQLFESFGIMSGA